MGRQQLSLRNNLSKFLEVGQSPGPGSLRGIVRDLRHGCREPSLGLPSLGPAGFHPHACAHRLLSRFAENATL